MAFDFRMWDQAATKSQDYWSTNKPKSGSPDDVQAWFNKGRALDKSASDKAAATAKRQAAIKANNDAYQATGGVMPDAFKGIYRR